MIRMKKFYFFCFYSFCSILLYGKPWVVDSLAKAPDEDTFTWYEGQNPQTAYLQKGLLAVFERQEKGTNELMSMMEMEGTKVLKEFHGVKIIQVSMDRFSKSLNDNEDSYSPVFSPVKNGSFPMALPGGVVVTFKKGMTEGKIKLWSKKRKLLLKKHLEVWPRTYLIQMGPGIRNLELAQELRELSEVEMAIPDWWRPLMLR